MKIDRFTGLDNLTPELRKQPTDLVECLNTDIAADGRLSRRDGFAQTIATAHRHLWSGPAFDLAVRGNDLVRVDTGAVLREGVGTARMWYVNLPDGRVAYSNGTVNGLTNGAAHTTWGVPIPAGVGVATDTAGSLHAGTYQYSISYVRIADGVEGGPAYAAPVAIALGGVALTGLPTLAGHRTNVYLTSVNGETPWLAGSTTGSTFSYTGQNNALQQPCLVSFCKPAPAGILPAFWRGRALVAVGNVLYPSRHNSPELFDMRREFKRFAAPITLVQPVQAGIFVGTTQELAFLPGEQWDTLGFRSVRKAAVVKGSGVRVPGQHLRRGEGNAGEGDCMVAICGGSLVAGYQDGAVAGLTDNRYAVAPDVAEVYASFRLNADREPQYIAIPQ